MKKLLMVAIILMVGVGAALAQKGEKAVGVQLNYGTEIESIGIAAKFQYGITDAIRIEPSFDYFFGKSGGNMFDFNVNAHYLFNVANQINVYPLVGFGYTSWKTGGSVDYNDYQSYAYEYENMGNVNASNSSRVGKIAVNLGAGAEYALNDKISVNAELKYQIISNFNQLVIGIGVTYKF